MRFWAGYSWQDNSDGSGAVRPDRVTLKLDKPVIALAIPLSCILPRQRRVRLCDGRVQ
ncbi:hypothetical protein ACLBOM_12025 [Escherichia coli]